MPLSRRRCTPLHRGSSAKPNVPWPRRSDKSFAVDEDRRGIARICEIASPNRLQWKGTSSFVMPIIRLDKNTSSRWKKSRLEFHLTVCHVIGAIENFRGFSRQQSPATVQCNSLHLKEVLTPQFQVFQFVTRFVLKMQGKGNHFRYKL